MKLKPLAFALSALAANIALAEEASQLDTIIISSDFRETQLANTANSVTVINGKEIDENAANSPENVLGQTANVNFTSGASRAHHIQIRGIGERSQYVQPINPSIGINIDGMDFSHSALSATLFDVDQIEILKGPQGTAYGSSAMAGMINIQSKQPTKEPEVHLESTLANYNTQAAGVAASGSLIKNTLLGRLSVYQLQSDGFMENSTLNRSDTQNRDELAIKGQLKWFASPKHEVDLNLIHLNLDNGYDAFTLDNSRTSHADEPGKDKQKTDAFALKSSYQLATAKLVTKLEHSNSDIEYSYDEDWSYNGEFDASLWPYSSFDQYLRTQKNTALDIRMVSDKAGRIFNQSTDWTFGVYGKQYQEDLTRNYTYLSGPFTSEFQSQNLATYGQLDSYLTPKLKLTTGLRIENWQADYQDNTTLDESHNELLYGGKLGLSYQAATNRLYYTSLSRGYKAGGFNTDGTLNADQRTFDTEYLWNLEAGVNSSHLENKLTSRFNLFYALRKDQQLKSSVNQLRSDGSTEFVDYLANAAEGRIVGLESEIHYRPNNQWHLFSNIGLLDALVTQYNNPDPTSFDLEGRRPAQAPSYQFNIGGDYRFASNWTAKANIQGKDSQYFSDSHNASAAAYTLVNSSLEYVRKAWTVNFWVKNLMDKDYDTRGFYFGNNPATGYANEVYTQKGDPRTFGVTLAYDY